MRHSFTHLVIAGLLLVGALGAYVYWYNMVIGEGSRAAALAEEISAKSESAKRASALKEALTQLAGSQGQVESYFVSETNIVAFLGELEKLGASVGARVKVNSVSAGGSKTDSSLTVSLTLDGSFDAVARAIGAIEFAPYAISVSSYSFGQRAGDKGSGWTASLTVTVGSTTLKPS